MKRLITNGLLMIVVAIIIGSCNQENVVSESNPQVTNQRISVSLFEQDMGYIGTGTRADVDRPLKSSKIFTELEVALIPINNENDSGYVIRQDSIDNSFGNIELEVPAGTYHLVAVAAATKTPSKGRISIKTNTEVRFPEDKVTDMVYTYKEITVTNSSSKEERQSFSASLVRPVVCFNLRSTDTAPNNIASEEIEISGACGYVFNPSTGKCKEEMTIYRKFSIDPEAYKGKTWNFRIYALPSGDGNSQVNVTAKALDKDNNLIRSCIFNNVTLEVGKYTRYTGPVFTNDNTIGFYVSSPDWGDSEYSQEFY